MTVYAIAQGRITDREQFQRYLEKSGPSLAAYDGRVLAVDEQTATIEGEADYPRTVIVAFESADQFHRWYNSPAYQAAKAEREHASVGRFILVHGI
ncbi:MAG: DUF1330 domain-containing protein [Gammaproteobacteria bacterium]|nr:DUF1330 domain-containing protein [Gammaproteobacteria bacterium]